MLIGISMDSSTTRLIEQLRPNLPSGVDLIGSESVDEMPSAREIEVSIGYWAPTEALAPKLRWIHWPSAGFDDAPAHLLSSLQWQFTHGGGPAAVVVAEWTLGVMLFFAHRFRKILNYERDRTWYIDRKKDISCQVLHGMTVGIIGYGAIGREVGRLCQAFGMQVHAMSSSKTQRLTYRTLGTGDPNGTIPDRWFKYDNLEQILPSWDYVVLGLRATDQTRHIINEQTLKYFKSSAVLVNPARGALVDEGALVEALQAGRLGGAALDVFETEPLPVDHPLRDAPNVLISPHCAPESVFFHNEILACVKENLRRFMACEPLLNVVTRKD